MLQRVINIRAGGSVQRCHTNPHIGSYNNAAHQWGVAMLLWELWPEDFPRLAVYCLTHDTPERWTGDSPATLKWYAPEVRAGLKPVEDLVFDSLRLPRESSLSEDDAQKLKNCDSLELYLWCLEQRKMGNREIEEICCSLEEFFVEKPLLAEAQILYDQIRTWGDYTFPQRLRELIPVERDSDISK